MITNLSIKQPWHKKYCHLKFSYSYLSANYATHYMLILTKNYAVKTGQPQNNWHLQKANTFEPANLQNILLCLSKFYNCYFYQLFIQKLKWNQQYFISEE